MYTMCPSPIMRGKTGGWMKNGGVFQKVCWRNLFIISIFNVLFRSSALRGAKAPGRMNFRASAQKS